MTLYGAGRLSVRLPTEHWFARCQSGDLPVFIEQFRLALSATLFRNPGWIIAQSPYPRCTGLETKRCVRHFFQVYETLCLTITTRWAIGGEFAALEQSLEQAGWSAVSARVEIQTRSAAVPGWRTPAYCPGLRIADQCNQRFAGFGSASRGAPLADTITVAVMPGLRYAWPEGAVYEFTAIYNAERLDYRGPAYGWWVIPDQYSLYRIHHTDSIRGPVHRSSSFFRPSTVMRLSYHCPRTSRIGVILPRWMSKPAGLRGGELK